MSGVAGFYRLGDRVAAPAEIDGMLQARAYRGPGSGGAWLAGQQK